MAAALRKILTFGSMLLPYGVHELKRRLKNRHKFSADVASSLAENRQLAGLHAGRRCFILGNGPSVKGLDLSRLQGETVITVSNGYLHSDFDKFQSRYHCVPQITYVTMTSEDVIDWFKEMHSHLGGAELFLSSTEAELVRKHNLFSGRTVRYLVLGESFDERPSVEIVDISKPVPRVDSVPVMALMIAMYLGFKEIILLGVDHDRFLSTSYEYAFELKVQKGKDFTVNADGSPTMSRHDDFQQAARLWRQYRAIANIARANDIGIFNSTPGGALDEFERRPFQAWFEE
ncbi:hypothetical protein GGE16_000572 [Rhizobium leguminosarum]|uniref:DUF115 domain-containing protein n=1 Tax=Rhizobium leguminosarum TaxID=384 RepID=A0AAE2MFY0_RHILE|nr:MULTISPECIES: hypothetical protein [Rhizobium]MBB4288556.1 hypothetical protein [Rhizobium leguminosarum]MBB4295351.1 hypothetical protein [Rhizobium leguminosarum]MBB4306744.1 hypothetical protein [Rhizobium leguminosarum]MBB4417674.1 hypothetical protein [Rhizobium leguminosarum]MBB4432519.1 hypothetical protein [Rhizobium esperanzae]